MHQCFEAGALATGSTLSTSTRGPDYADLRPDRELLELYRGNATALGRVFPDTAPVAGAATDMGNVSHRVPTIDPMLGLDCLPAVNHQPDSPLT